MLLVKNLPLAYNRDLQDDKRHLFDSYDSTMDCIEMAIGIVSTAAFQPEHIAENIDAGYLDATVLAEYLVTCDVPFRTAHQLVGQLVAACEDRGLGKLSALPLDVFNEVCDGHVTLTGEVFETLGAANVVGKYQSAGAAGTAGYRQQVEAYRQLLDTLEGLEPVGMEAGEGAVGIDDDLNRDLDGDLDSDLDEDFDDDEDPDGR
jgi:argininosuccinate lyase